MLQEIADFAEKLKLIDDNTKGVSPFGQPFGEVYRRLDALTFDFEVTEFGIPFGTTTTKHHALDILKAAKASKEALQDQVIQPVVSISATFYPKGAAGACDDTQFHPKRLQSYWAATPLADAVTKMAA